jgi:hypothetical protein
LNLQEQFAKLAKSEKKEKVSAVRLRPQAQQQKPQQS